VVGYLIGVEVEVVDGRQSARERADLRPGSRETSTGLQHQ
jgi:hypothetical protein